MNHDPRDIERIHPATPASNTSVNDTPDTAQGSQATPKIQGAIVNQDNAQPQDKAEFPAKGEGENKKSQGDMETSKDVA